MNTPDNWKEEFKKTYYDDFNRFTDIDVKYEDIKDFIESLLLSQKQELAEKCCPPHNMIPHTQTGAWSASVPPPNMKCTKCLMTERF